ncbi:hypothetical protein [Streptomyces cyaneofuscatus]|uniref:CopG family transcriptional regulator n=1 Tax=Streptomyces cyaneofuscatus TaxID=66883 RepID=A0ABZ1F848_9ACTN|nr:hypothetical protein [Streptomyces cyaneofuscatus]WSB12626.1 hypothetical protein OG849_35465 [Streptomyces cyaneofuscatus]WSD51158.1 hypothetical protein OG857_35650 [Streptomyces cyaneofuscatus]WSD51189.1 hypothetical protein OG857_35495 [Streptomyces cyaneofuscatus]
MPRHEFETPDDVPEPPLTPNTGGVGAGADLGRRRKAAAANDWKSFSSYLPEDLQRRFRAECAMSGIEVRSGLDQAVRTWLDSRQASKPAG